jgi:endonuclease/exonuclease/phosphatase family metal-dependent hydrolase
MSLYSSRQFSFLLAAVALAWVVAENVSAAADSGRLHVLTFNIHAGRGADGKMDLERIAKTIRDARPDLVALQEVDRGTKRSGGRDQLEELTNLTGLHSAFGKAIDHDGGVYGVAVLSRHNIVESKTHALPSNPDREQRVALEVRIQVAELPPLIFVCTHLDHYEDDQDRMAQATKLLELFSKGTGLAIIAGDINAAPDSRVLQTLGRHWRPADADHLRPTAPAAAPRHKIDYILIDRHRPWSVHEARVVEDRASSDHLPVLAELVYERESVR